MSNSSGPVRSFWNACLLLLGAIFVLWVAYQLFVSMWIWVVGIVAVAVMVALIVLWLRARSRRW